MKALIPATSIVTENAAHFMDRIASKKVVLIHEDIKSMDTREAAGDSSLGGSGPNRNPDSGSSATLY